MVHKTAHIADGAWDCTHCWWCMRLHALLMVHKAVCRSCTIISILLATWPWLVFASLPPPPQIATYPPRMEAASLDITKAYWNLPILPRHKKYLPILWRDPVFVQHVAIEGLVTTGGIQGTIADACLGILDFHGIRPTIKWVDDFIFFCELTYLLGRPQFHYNLSDILVLTKPLGIPWHSISKKGQDFTFHFNCVRFHWDISTKCVTSW